MEIEERKKQLQQLHTYNSGAHKDIQNVVERLGWTLDHKSNDDVFVNCPLNAEHRVPVRSLQKHVDLCAWRSEGYHDEDLPLPDACDAGAAMNSIVIDSQLANAIIQEAARTDPHMKTGGLRSVNHPAPRTADRIVTDFTADERRFLYDYVVSKSEGRTVKLEDLHLPFQVEKKGDQPKTLLEVLASERDAKRRRISHRTKKVSTNRKSHVEIMREVIGNQMELYTEWLNQDEKQNADEARAEEPRERQSSGQEREYERKPENPQDSHVNRRRGREGEREKPRQSGRSYDRHATTSRDRSRDRSRHSHSSRRDQSSKRSRDDRNNDERRTRQEDYGDRRDRKDRSGREENGRHGHEERSRYRKEGEVRRDTKSGDYYPSDISQQKSLHGRSHAASGDDGNDPHKVIKTEHLDRVSTCTSPSKDKKEDEEGITINTTGIDICSKKDVPTNIRTLPNEWSEDSENGSVPKRKKGKKKKQKKSKHKRKKHSKDSKRSISSNSGSSDFSC